MNELEEAVMKLDPVKIQKTLPFVATLGMFNKVVESCFGQNLDPKYKEFIKTFSQQYRTLNISITPKVSGCNVLKAMFSNYIL